MLQHERVDMLMCSDMSAFALIKSLGYNKDDYEIVYSFDSTALSVAFNKNTDDKLIATLQKTLDDMKKTPNGSQSEYEIILNSYR